jgi:hypothetical protein
MPLYVVERQHAEQMKLTELGVQSLEKQNLDEGLRWVFSFLTADQHKSYCLYEAPSATVIHAAARRAGLPAAVVVEVQQVSPDMLPTAMPGTT